MAAELEELIVGALSGEENEIHQLSTKIKSSLIHLIFSQGIIISLLLENKLINLLVPPWHNYRSYPSSI